MSISNIMPNKAQDLRVHLLQGTALAIFLTGLSFVVGIQMEWITTINYLEVFAVFTSYLCTFLCVVERRANYPVGIITTAAYCVLFYQWGLLGSMAVNAYLVVTLIYGWFRWGHDKKTRPVTRLQLKWVPVYLLVTAGLYAGALGLVTAFGGTLALTDTVILIGTVLAQILLDNKKIETWAVWAVVNVFAIYTYANAGLALAAFQYVFVLANTAYGAYMWAKSREVTTEPATTPQLVPATA
jgi:nicotinamide mononucleotide transporter